MTPIAAVLVASILGAGPDVARVGATAITSDAFAQRAQALRARGDRPTADAVLSSLVDEAVLAEEARRQGLQDRPDVAERIVGQRRFVIGAALVDQTTASMPGGTEDDLRASFHATTDFVRVQLFLYASEADARAGAARLAAGAAPLTEVKAAKRAEVSARDADAPYAMRAQLAPDLAKLLFGSRVGSWIGPAHVSGDWVVAKVVEIIIGPDADFQAARPALEARARARLGGAAREHLVSKLRAATPPRVDEALLASVNPLEATAEQLRRPIAWVGRDTISLSELASTLGNLAASAGSSHAVAPETRRKALDSLVDAHLLAIAATDRGLAQAPEVQAQLVLVERGVLAESVVTPLLRPTGKPGDDPAMRARAYVDQLRKKTKLSVDQEALARAASALR